MTYHSATSASLAGLARAFAWRLLLALLLWWALAEGVPESWRVGLPVALVVALLATALAAPTRFVPRPLGALRFLTYFLGQSLVAGIDVARRALHPRLSLSPQLIDVELTLPPGAPRWVLAMTLGLLPGTLAVTLEGEHLRLHVFDRDQYGGSELRQAERHVAALFGLPWRER